MCFLNSGPSAPVAETHRDAPSLMEKNWKVAFLYGNRNCPEERNTDDELCGLWVMVVFSKIERYCVCSPENIGAWCPERLGNSIHCTFISLRKIYQCKRKAFTWLTRLRVDFYLRLLFGTFLLILYFSITNMKRFRNIVYFLHSSRMCHMKTEWLW